MSTAGFQSSSSEPSLTAPPARFLQDPYLPTRPDGSRDLDTESWSYIKTWQAMEKLVSTGKVKAIGVSNCSIAYLEEILKVATVVPACDQMEVHVLNPELKLNEYCKSKG